jgi:hypothetical protein
MINDALDINELIDIFNKLSKSKKYALYQFAPFLNNSDLDTDPLFQKTLEDIRLARNQVITNSKELEQLIEDMEAG